MIARYQTLRQRIQHEHQEIDHTVSVIQRHWEKAKSADEDQVAYVNSVALNLHGFYAGLERIFQLIAIELDGATLGGEAWHSELLQQMTLDIPEVRPPALEPETARRLDEYRKFRHLIRNIYATNIDPARVQNLVTKLPSLWTDIQHDVDAFVDFLAELAQADEEA